MLNPTVLEVTLGQYHSCAEIGGNRLELFRDGASAGSASWHDGRIEQLPEQLSEDARDELTSALEQGLARS